MDTKSGLKPKEVRISARVIRANGDVEDLGVISHWYRNPLKRILRRITQWLH